MREWSVPISWKIYKKSFYAQKGFNTDPAVRFYISLWAFCNPDVELHAPRSVPLGGAGPHFCHGPGGALCAERDELHSLPRRAQPDWAALLPPADGANESQRPAQPRPRRPGPPTRPRNALSRHTSHSSTFLHSNSSNFTKPTSSYGRKYWLLVPFLVLFNISSSKTATPQDFFILIMS